MPWFNGENSGSYLALPAHRVIELCQNYFVKRQESIDKAVYKRAKEILEENLVYNRKWYAFKKRDIDINKIVNDLRTNDKYTKYDRDISFWHNTYLDYVSAWGAIPHDRVIELRKAAHGLKPEGTVYVSSSMLAMLESWM